MAGIITLAVALAIVSTIALVICVQNCEPEYLFYPLFGYIMMVIFIIMLCC